MMVLHVNRCKETGPHECVAGGHYDPSTGVLVICPRRTLDVHPKPPGFVESLFLEGAANRAETTAAMPLAVYQLVSIRHHGKPPTEVRFE